MIFCPRLDREVNDLACVLSWKSAQKHGDGCCVGCTLWEWGTGPSGDLVPVWFGFDPGRSVSKKEVDVSTFGQAASSLCENPATELEQASTKSAETAEKKAGVSSDLLTEKEVVKECNRCGLLKDITKFRSKKRGSGTVAVCKSCERKFRLGPWKR
jgi:RNase P subunit RPR2